MLLEEYTFENALEAEREEAYEEGREEGINDILKLINQGLSIEELKQKLIQTRSSNCSTV